MAKQNLTHPEGLDEVHAVDVTDEIKEFVSTTSKDIEQERTNRSRWERRLDRLRDLRYGYRKAKTIPWIDSANYSIPLIDAHINRIKPAYVNLLYGVSPIASFVPFGAEDVEPAKKKEVLFDWQMRTKVRMFDQYCIGCDKELEQGSVVYKITWNYSTRTYQEEFDVEDLDRQTIEALSDKRVTNDMLAVIMIEERGIDTDFEENIEEVKKAVKSFREGEKQIALTLIEIENDQPEVKACSVREDIVVPVDTTELQNARFIDQPFWLTTNQVKQAMNVEKYIEYDDETIKGWGRTNKKYHGEPREKSELSDAQDDLILFHETCVWYDINGTGIKEKCVTTWPDNNPTDVLRFIEVPYDHGLFPYEQVRREFNDPSFYSPRGIADLDEDYQVGITNSINQAEDNGTIINKPVIVARKNLVTNIANRSYTPGEFVETNGDPSGYQIRQGANASQLPLFQFAQYLKGWSDQRLGNVGSGLSSPTDLPGSGGGGKKTAKEIDLTAALQGQVQSLDLQIHQQQMAKVFYQIDALYDQFGSDEEEVLITNEAPQKINRREIQGRYDIVPNGRLDNSNPALKAQKAFNLMRMFAGDADINQYEMKKIFLMDYDHRIGAKILFTPEEKQQQQQQIQQVQAAVKQAAIKEGIDLKQIDIMLDVMKERMLVPIQGRKFAPDTVKETGNPVAGSRNP